MRNIIFLLILLLVIVMLFLTYLNQNNQIYINVDNITGDVSIISS